jgi:hypothetical protein
MGWRVQHDAAFGDCLTAFIWDIDAKLAVPNLPTFEQDSYELDLKEVDEFQAEAKNLKNLVNPLYKLVQETTDENGNSLPTPRYALKVNTWTGYYEVDHSQQLCYGYLAIHR